MNKLLLRQLRRNKIDLDSIPNNFKQLFADISRSYDHNEDDRALIERSMDLSSQELTETNKKLRHETFTQRVVLENIRSALMSLPERDEMNFTSGRFEEEDIIALSDFLNKQIQRRKEAEKTLKLYEKAISSSSNGIIITDFTLPDNPVIFANPAFYKTTGYTAEEVMGKNCRFLQGTDKEQDGLNEIRKALKEKRACSVMLRNYKKDGTMFWNQVSLNPIYDSEGNVTNYIGVQNDVSRGVLIEEQLRELNNRLSEIIENMLFGILVEDERRRLVVTNTEFCRMFSVPVEPKQLVGGDCAMAANQSKDLFLDPDGFLKRIDDILVEGKAVRNEELALKDGRVFERDFIPIIIDNRYNGYLWNYRDITERKKIESEVSDLKLFYEKTLNDIPGQIAVLDADYRYVYVNPASIKSPEVRKWIIGKNDFEFCVHRNIDSSIADRRRKRLDQAVREKKMIRFDEKLNRGDLSFYFERVISPIFGENGEVKRLLVYGVDITERKRFANELLEIKAQLEASNKALSDFAYIASHDLREPLRKITAFGSLLAKTAHSKLDEDDKENLNYMILGASRMQQMIDDLLQYSRISAKTQSFHLVPLGEIVNEITSFDLAALIDDAGAKIVMENELGNVTGERIHVKQIMQNLIANAIKYRKKDTVAEVRIRSKREGEFMYVEVEDNGIGIPVNYHQQIFEMFRRLHAREEYGGSGIGLAVCKKIVELYLGEIGVRSVPGTGSVFWFKFPATGE